MDWTSVAVFADEGDEGLTRIRTALNLSEAHITAILVVAAPALPFGYDPAGVMLQDFAHHLKVARDAAQAKAARLDRDLQNYRPRLTISSLVVEPVFAARAVAAAARCADAVVIAQPKSGQSSIDSAVLKGALMASGRPCLVLPRWLEPRSLNGRALVAWKGTPEAARAVRDAIPLLKRCQSVRIFCASVGGELDGEGPEGLARLAAWLTRHGVRVEAPTPTPPVDDLEADAGALIREEANAFGADLLVMGGYGHARLAEMVFGGATQRLLYRSDCAILLSH